MVLGNESDHGRNSTFNGSGHLRCITSNSFHAKVQVRLCSTDGERAHFYLYVYRCYVAQWKPTATIRIDEDFEGTVYLIPAVEAATQFAPDENVIIYWNTERESDVRVLHRSKDISNVLNEAGSSTLNWYRSDSTLWRSLHISCLEIVPGRQCPQAPWNNRHPQCLDREDYDTWVMEGIIDVEKVEFFELN